MGNVAKEGGIAFANGKKPVRLLKQLIKWADNNKDGIILDLFGGSGTTAQAVMEANSEDGESRRFVLVQVAEVPDPKSDAAKEGYSSIAQLARERIRKAGASILSNLKTSDQNLDVGFRFLKIGSSNMADIYYTPDAASQDDLIDAIDNIKPDRTPEDLLFQVMLDWGVDLALPITKQPIQGKDVFFVDGNVLAACFDASGSVDEAFVKELAKHQPLRVVFRDAGYKNSAVKINVEQIFKLLSPATEVKCI